MKNQEPKRKKIVIPRDFVHWWEPWGNDKATGASIGGHPDALRMWARPEPDGTLTRRMLGIKTKVAWLCQIFQDEFNEWKEIGSPERKDFISMAATLEKQKEFWIDVAPFIAMIGKDERSKGKIREEYKTVELAEKLTEKYRVPS